MCFWLRLVQFVRLYIKVSFGFDGFSLPQRSSCSLTMTLRRLLHSAVELSTASDGHLTLTNSRATVAFPGSCCRLSWSDTYC